MRLPVLGLLAVSAIAQTSSFTVSIDAAANRRPISPLIYGMNYATPEQLRDLNCPLNRQGGNAQTQYNWQLNADNRGNDWYFESLADSSSIPGERSDTFISQTQASGAEPMITIPMIGWVAKVGPNRGKLASYSVARYGAQKGTDARWFADAGNGVLQDSGAEITANDPTDANVPADPQFQSGWVHHLVDRWGAAPLKFYLLDNEPSLWHGTHRDVHANGASMEEMRDRTIDYSTMIKSIDPAAQVAGPEEWGWPALQYSGADQQWGPGHNYRNYPDRAHHGNMDFYPWFLDQLRQSAIDTGQRPLDVVTIHWYPQGGEGGDDVSAAKQLLRNRSTRSLWDPNYVDESWIHSKVNLIPRLRGWVNDYYFPDARIGITEYNWGAESHISGALAQADVLGIFGREGLDLAARWTTPATQSLTYKAIQMYRNYDGQRGTFGDSSVSAQSPDPDNVAVFAARRSVDGALTIMALNKQLTATADVDFNLANFPGAGSAKVYQLTAAGSILRRDDLSWNSTGFAATLPPQSVTLIVLPGS